MKILITSGGTKVPIDSVRSITNMSKGTFGAQIAEEFWNNSKNINNEIIFLYAKGSKLPYLSDYDAEFGCAINWAADFKKIEYETFQQYRSKLFSLLSTENPDIVILAAAVSDYEVENIIDGKIRSSDDLIIRLKPAQKLISKVKEFCPKTILCGFKLLVNSTEKELIQAAQSSINDNGCDIVVANDLSTIKDTENHSLIINTPNWHKQFFRKDYYLPNVVYNFCMYSYMRKS